jgi:uncharacterized NAD(P)/FAD-binding protein YdhS
MRTDRVIPARICIVGGGFSGTLVLASLVAQAREPLSIELFEPRREPGTGTAYATRERSHLLNVQAGRMGACEAGDFFAWLQTERGRTMVARYCPGHDVAADDYLPRAIYGHYLKDMLANTRLQAWLSGVVVRVTRAAVTDLALTDGGIEATYQRKGLRARTAFDVVVLATGNHASRTPAFIAPSVRCSERYIADMWDASAVARLPDAGTCSRKSVLILGTGLTAVDAILTLEARGFAGRILAVSRNGLLPRPQFAEPRKPWALSGPPSAVRPSARAYLAWLRDEAATAEAAGIDWRNVLDAVRPFTQTLWQKLDHAERSRIVRRLSWWNVHRHRMAPAAAAQIDALRRDGKLDVRAARIVSARWRPGGFVVRLRHGQKVENVRASWVLNCMGPDYDAAADPLLKKLLQKGLVVRAGAGGIAARNKAIAAGKNDGRIFALGSLLVGELLETMAVPELRELARHVARLVHARLDQNAALPDYGASLAALRPGSRAFAKARPKC